MDRKPFLDALKTKSAVEQNRGGWYIAHCPLAAWRHEDGVDKSPAFAIRDDHGDAFCNCLAGETRIVTRQEIGPIRKFAGQYVDVLTSTGEWVSAPIRSFGVQPLKKLVLQLNGVRRVEHATSGHRWFVRGGGVRTTDQLKPGHRLEAVLPTAQVSSLDPIGVQHGLVFGDGTVGRGYASIRLYGACRALANLFKGTHVTYEEDHTRVHIGRRGADWKATPSLEAGAEYLAGFISGWIAADGHVTKHGDVVLNGVVPGHFEWLRLACLRIGLAVHPTKMQMRTGYGHEPTPIYGVSFVRSVLPESIFCREDQRAAFKTGRFDRLRWTVVSVEPTNRVEEVFCATVAGTHSFALEHNLLTGNCFACGFSGSQSDLVLTMNMLNQKTPMGKFEFGKAMSLIEDEPEDTGVIADDVPDIEELLLTKRKVHVFSESWVSSFPPVHKVAWAMQYLASRDVGPQLASDLGLRADTNQGRVCFPVYDFQHRLRGLHGRAVSAETDPRYRMYTYKGQNNPLVWLGEQWVDLDKPLVVVEGPMDLAAVRKVYRNVASPLFASPSKEKLSRMADAYQWVTFLDNGKGGNIGRTRIETTLTDHLVEHARCPEHRKDPGEMPVEELAEELSKYVPLDDFLID